MKIKKVEIQAFRAYNEVKDCTFDFQRDDGKYADFISIYAPNGFGKTSFYDAVEWVITNNIYRFTRNSQNRSYALDEKQFTYELNKSKSPQYILRNKNSASTLEGFVKLYQSDPDDIKVRNIPTVVRKDSTDYEFDEKNTVNAYFRDVILSQENIDAFLREDNPERRYEKFMNYFGDVDLNRQYTNILQLIKVNDQRLNGLQKELISKKAELNLDVDLKILQKVNKVIQELNETGESIKEIIPDFNEEELLNFTNHLIDRRVTLRHELDATELSLEHAKKNELNIDSYISNINKLSLALNEQSRLLEHERESELFIKAKNEALNISAEINSQNEVLRLFTSIKYILPRFIELKSYIKVQEQDKEVKVKDLDLYNASFDKLSNELVTLKAASSKCLSSLFQVESKLNETYDRSTELRSYEIEINNLISSSKGSLKLIEDCNNAIKLLETKERAIHDDITQLNSNEIPNRLRADSTVYILLFDFDDLILKLKDSNVQLSKIESDIASQTSLDDSLKKLISIGSDIVKAAKKDHCPLCNHKFSSFDEMSQAIINNPLFTEQTQNLMERKTQIKTYISEVTLKITEIISELLSKKRSELLIVKENHTRLIHTRNQIYISQKENNNKLDLVKATRKEILSKLEGLDFDAFISKYNNELVQLREINARYLEQLDLKEQERREIEITIESLKKSISTIELRIKESMLKSEIYEVESFVSQFRIQSMLEVSLVENMITDKIQEIDIAIQYEKTLNETINEFKVKLRDKSDYNLVERKNLLQNFIEDIKIEISRYEQAFKDDLSNQILIRERSELLLCYHNIKFEIENNIKQYKDKLEKLEKVDAYKSNILPFLQYTRIQRRNRDIQNSINKFSRLDILLQEEKNNLSAFINEQIHSFFYEELINTLYQKIDPHPDYKTIKFRCDFNGDHPKLNVFVNGDEDVHLIPNLYFSTAQINILSLSIFLAKALNAKDDNNQPIDCIFIDDPVQSMDSINILSTVDLLRSLLVNFNKQIILSTHDENFHELLKKKMPTSLFNSKFLEFETFGTLKA